MKHTHTGTGENTLGASVKMGPLKSSPWDGAMVGPQQSSPSVTCIGKHIRVFITYYQNRVLHLSKDVVNNENLNYVYPAIFSIFSKYKCFYTMAIYKV